MLFKKAKSRRSEKNRFRRVFLEQLEDRRLLTGLVTVVDINQGNSGSDPSHFQFLGDSTVLFSAETTTLGRELWKTDGTTGGTLLVKDLSAGSSSSNPTDLTKVGDVIFFVADDENGLAQIWKTDGSGAGTQKISDFSGHIDPPRNLTALGNSLFFKLNTPANGTEPWISDGTSAGTVMLKDLVDGSFGSNPESTVIWNSKIYFRAQPGAGQPTTLWETDGTQAGTVNLGIPAEVVFKFEQGIVTKVGPTLRYYDGSATHLISSPNVSEIEGMVATNAQVYVGAKNNVEYGREVAVIDVDSKSLELVKDIRPGTGNSLPNGSTHRGLVGESLGSSLFFTAEGVNSSGFELWISDGTATGTELVSDMNPGANSSFPQWFVAHQGEMFFVNRFSGDFELTLNLWKSDGTINGTVDVFAQESVNPKINIEPYSSDIGLMLNGWTENLGRELWIYSANFPPTLGALSDVTIAEDTAEQTVNLTGITAGGGESQPLRVTATSSNIDLIADPTVVYTSAEATGSLKFTPLADQHGTSTITVTVEDGGMDNNLATSEDNATTSRTFDVTVNPVNDEPTIETLVNTRLAFEDFTDPSGWSSLGSGVNGNDFGQSDTSHAGGVTGEAGGRFTRSGHTRYYADTTLTGLDLGKPIEASGKLDHTSANRPDFGRPMLLGHFDVDNMVDQGIRLGITFTNAGSTDNSLFWRADLGSVAAGTPIEISANSDLEWSYQWDPHGGTDLVGALTVNLNGTTQVIELTTAQRSSLAAHSLGGFGFLGVAKPDDNESGWYADLFIDDVTYTQHGTDRSIMAYDLETQALSTVVDTSAIAGFASEIAVYQQPAGIVFEEDAPEKTIDLTGITTGSNEDQPLRVTVISDNTDLIAEPTIDYTQGESTGTLNLTLGLHESGECTVTVTVEDGGLDNDLATLADNLSVSTAFVVTVHEIYEWHNYDLPEDVNQDGIVTPLDALIVINHLNTHGSTLLSEDTPTNGPWYDVSKDGWVSPLDAMITINYLNPTSYEVQVGVVPLDGDGNQLSSVFVGDVFYLALVTEDMRDEPAGVFAAYGDVYYASNYLTLAGTPIYDSPYINGISADLTEAGLINEWGAFAGLDKTNGGSYVVSRIPMKAIRAGSMVFGASSADVLPSHDVLLYGTTDTVKPSSIEYIASELLILEGAEGEYSGEGEDFFTRDGLQLLSSDNYLSDELEDTLDLLLGPTSD